MNSDVPALGIRFSIDRLEAQSSIYGQIAWDTIFRAFPLERLRGETEMFEGDSLGTVQGHEYVYCVVFQNEDRTLLDELAEALEHDERFLRLSDERSFVRGGDVIHEPLIPAGYVDAAGNLESKPGSTCRNAIVAIRREKRLATPPTEPTTAWPERQTSASSRIAALPPVASLKEIEACLEQSFSKAGQEFWFYLTPEELCELVAQYQDVVHAHWRESDGFNGDVAEVVLTAKNDTEGRNLEFRGLFPFASALDAWGYCRENDIVPTMWGVDGPHACYFQGRSGNPVYWNLAEHRVSADELWIQICRRRQELGIPAQPNLSRGQPIPVRAPSKADTTVTTSAAAEAEWLGIGCAVFLVLACLPLGMFGGLAIVESFENWDGSGIFRRMGQMLLGLLLSACGPVIGLGLHSGQSAKCGAGLAKTLLIAWLAGCSAFTIWGGWTSFQQAERDVITMIKLRGAANALDFWEGDSKFAMFVTLAPNTEHLRLSGSRMSNSALKNLPRLPKLRRLWLDSKNFTDGALPYLRDLPALEELMIAGASISPDAAQQLMRERANLKVTKEFRPWP